MLTKISSKTSTDNYGRTHTTQRYHDPATRITISLHAAHNPNDDDLRVQLEQTIAETIVPHGLLFVLDEHPC